MLTEAGYEHYEVSNFCLPGRRSRHNFVYWTGAPYAAAGPGAHAFHPPERRWNLRSWSEYRETLEAGELPIADRETVSLEARELERFWLALRTADGLHLPTPTVRQSRLLEQWEEGALAGRDGHVIRLTPAGWLLLDELALQLSDARRESDGSAARRPIDARRRPVQIGATPTSSRQ
jgi:oxygen-independent coproporphyrinogen-3 oxidase